MIALGAQSAAAAEPNICVAANGEQRVIKGIANCVAIGTGSTAVAKGTGTTAEATGGTRNKARVRGISSAAFVGPGDGNTATVVGGGPGNIASADGTNNTATMIGDASHATADSSLGCTATAIGDGVTQNC